MGTGSCKKKNKQLAAEIKKIKPLTNFFTASAQAEKDVEASVSTTPDIPVQSNRLKL
jgi:outer membrane protein assembly factor BamE (lipoprotein component of BamABCDE complex)